MTHFTFTLIHFKFIFQLKPLQQHPPLTQNSCQCNTRKKISQATLTHTTKTNFLDDGRRTTHLHLQITCLFLKQKIGEPSYSSKTGSAKKKGKKPAVSEEVAKPPALDRLMERGAIADVEVRPNGRIMVNQVEYASLAMDMKAYTDMPQEVLASDAKNMLRMMFLVQMHTTQNTEARLRWSCYDSLEQLN